MRVSKSVFANAVLTLSTQGVSISNAFNAIYVEASDTFSTQYTHVMVCMLMQLTQSNYNVDSST